jgi:triacylglycerol lipase
MSVDRPTGPAPTGGRTLRRWQALPRAAAGIAAEARWTVAHLARYPFGLFGDLRPGRSPRGGGSARRLRPLVRDVEATSTPILSVHGIVDNHTIFSSLERTLRREGFHRLASFDYGLATRDVRRAAERLAEAVDGLLATAGTDRIHMIGHSLGGLVARYYVQRMGGDAVVGTLVTLGTPHRGTALAGLIPRPPVGRLLPLLAQLRPDSALIRELDQPAPGCRTRFVCVASDLDHLVRPTRNGWIDHPDLDVRNVTVRGIGHLSLTNSPRVAAMIAEEFSKPC